MCVAGLHKTEGADLRPPQPFLPLPLRRAGAPLPQLLASYSAKKDPHFRLWVCSLVSGYFVAPLGGRQRSEGLRAKWFLVVSLRVPHPHPPSSSLCKETGDFPGGLQTPFRVTPVLPSRSQLQGGLAQVHPIPD